MNSFFGWNILYTLEEETASFNKMNFQCSRLAPEPKGLLICGASFFNLLPNHTSLKVLILLSSIMLLEI